MNAPCGQEDCGHTYRTLVKAQNRVAARLRLASTDCHQQWNHHGSWKDCPLVTCAGDKQALKEAQ